MSLRPRAVLALAAILALGAALARAQDAAKTIAFADPPKEWKSLPPRGGFGPKIELELPAAEGETDPAKVTVHFFGGSGGDWKANLERWASQFKTADGNPVDPAKVKVEDAEANGLKVKIAWLEGTWTPASMGPMAKKADPKPGSKMVAAMVDGPDGPYFVRLVGSKKTVDKHEADYLKWLKTAKAVEKKS